MSGRSRQRFIGLALVLLIASAARGAHAEPQLSTNDRVQPLSSGWLLIALTSALGAGLTAGASTITCDEHDSKCARWASLGIWTGVGLASVGAVAGLLIVEADVRAARRRMEFRVALPEGGRAPRVTLSLTF